MHTVKILVVDDSPTMRQLIIFALQRLSGVQITEAGDGVAALKQLSNEKYDLLLTDVNMPMMGGLKLISLMRNDALYADIPVIVISTEGSDVTRERAIAAGANDYITKPLQTTRLIEVVRRLLDPELQQS